MPLLSPPECCSPQSFPIFFHENETKKTRRFIFFSDFLPDSHACFDSEIKCPFLWGFWWHSSFVYFFPVGLSTVIMFKIFLKILGFFFGFMISDSKAVFIYVILVRVVKQKYYSPPSKDSLSLLQSPGLVQTFKEFI